MHLYRISTARIAQRSHAAFATGKHAFIGMLYGEGLGGTNLLTLDSITPPALSLPMELRASGALAASPGFLLLSEGPFAAPFENGTFLVDPTASGLERRAEKTMALDAHSHIALEGVRVAAAERLTEGGTGWQAWRDTLHEGVILLGGQAMGGAERALEMTVAYAKERQQFGKPLGAFQSLAHYMADAATIVDGGRTLVYEAAWAADQGRSIRRLAPMAKSFACSTFRDVTKMAQQIHGGMGFSVEYDIQLYFRRAKQLQVTWWDTAYCEDLVAADVLDGDGPPDLRAAPS